MLITRTSPFSGKTTTMDLPVTEEQVARYVEAGVPVQDAFPNLTPDQREFILTGITKDEWPSDECAHLDTRWSSICCDARPLEPDLSPDECDFCGSCHEHAEFEEVCLDCGVVLKETK